jgi:hypothetical protein
MMIRRLMLRTRRPPCVANRFMTRDDVLVWLSFGGFVVLRGAAVLFPI